MSITRELNLAPPGSCTDPLGAPGDLKQPRFPYDEHLVATIRPLDDYSNTYIGLYVEDPTLGLT